MAASLSIRRRGRLRKAALTALGWLAIGLSIPMAGLAIYGQVQDAAWEEDDKAWEREDRAFRSYATERLARLLVAAERGCR